VASGIVEAKMALPILLLCWIGGWLTPVRNRVPRAAKYVKPWFDFLFDFYI